MNIRTKDTLVERRDALEKEVAVKLEAIKNGDTNDLSQVHCENLIGFTQVPLGVAGPLQVKSQPFGSHAYYLPLATTEGALVASVNRGCKAITQSGGAHVLTEKIGITRAPVFLLEDILAGQQFCTWVTEHENEIKHVAETTSSHITLLNIQPFLLGCYVYLRFSFDTQDAMGMNMATIAVDKTVAYITEQTKAVCIALSGNLCVDKKANYMNFIEGRGVKVWADVLLSEEIVKGVLKTTVREIVEVHKAKIQYGSLVSGSIGANAQVANILAAIFLATGQDVAHVSECSTGVTQLEDRDGVLYASIYLPDLIIGTVGGGTGLPTQKEALHILGLAGGNEGNNAIRFAEVIGGAVLAGELSLLAALSSHDLAKAHQALGRNKKI